MCIHDFQEDKISRYSLKVWHSVIINVTIFTQNL